MTGENVINESVTALSDEECWDLLRQHDIGRLGFHLLDQVHVVPINYAVDDGSLLFRTAEGNKLLGVVMHGDVVLEVDDQHGDTAWSVIVRGTAHLLDEASAHRAEALPLRSWVADSAYNVVEILPEELTGRMFRPNPAPWSPVSATPG